MNIRKTIPFFILSLFLVEANAQIVAYFSRCAFNTPDNKPYLETYISVLGNSVSFKKTASGKYQGVVEIGMLFSQNGMIKASKKYNLLSPEQNDTLNRPPFIDQQRFLLDTGTYELEVMIVDKNINGKKFSLKEAVKISFSPKKVNISDMEMLASLTKAEKPGPLTKSGFDLIPYSSDFYPSNVKDILFYAEIYNTKDVLGENEKFLISYYIESYENRVPLSKYVAYKKETTGSVNAILSGFNMADLPSGNYNLVVDVKDKTNQLVGRKKVFFQRKNIPVSPKVDVQDLASITVENTFASRIEGKDSLRECISSLRPIASEAEKVFMDNQLRLADEKLMQQFFYNFWLSRSRLSPEVEWQKYNADVKAVNAKFGSFNYKGYETDRGRVYLQYGPPDKRDLHPSEPNAYPYEIWIYYTLEDKSGLQPNQRNKQFIFYNRDLSSDLFQVLHSDALGETYDVRWEMKLHARTVQSHDFEQKTAPNHFGGNSRDEFGSPK